MMEAMLIQYGLDLALQGKEKKPDKMTDEEFAIIDKKAKSELNEMCTALIIYIGSEPSYALNPDWEGVRSTRTRTNLTLFHSLKATDFCCLET
ncbi:uncharacterized protein LOC107823736 isoform X4 [Nicotiana tabacum]|uniref:Uncharacterized protein LOC107823736 isoform X4 n=1 Tax=Nicotiana tabacum TaxID=4097 RepID=A0AC58SHQ0_TOBAC